MKVLFICQRNNGRSQMAKGIYNKLTNSHDASAAGIAVDNHGQLLKERATEAGSDVGKVIEVMKEIGVDVSGSPRIQLDLQHVDQYDLVIAILEPSTIPNELKNIKNLVIWDISDPKTKDLDGVRTTRHRIESKVRELI